MHSINDIMGKAPALDNTNGAATTHVLAGQTFWGLTSGEWGVQTGMLEIAPCDCTGGTLNGTRWCDNGDGTVTDLLGDSSNNNSGQCLVWLQDASWGGQKKWVDSSTWDDAQTRAGTLVAGTGVVTDSSVEGDWRLPTKIELNGLANSGTEDVRTGEVRAFTGIQV
ncbi:MAG: DUF1566 domain-containing protein, partial [Gammaproteobacteria bacterium]|nr:DUF1566 domain-containing protein [Gammaproteobacteria bacterium]